MPPYRLKRNRRQAKCVLLCLAYCTRSSIATLAEYEEPGARPDIIPRFGSGVQNSVAARQAAVNAECRF
jgi:hypothetical protein